jgi:phosphoribosylformylglycinamidine synthase subunit PurS
LCEKPIFRANPKIQKELIKNFYIYQKKYLGGCTMYKVKIYVTLKNSVIDPQGSAAKQTLETMGYKEIEELRIGKYIEITIDESVKNVDEMVNEFCHKLLVNPVVENYRYEIEAGVKQ